ncbi:PREDICTED: adhesion G protein-coupled receptor E3-like [Priapulus caudatus]|uniref:Adhesion G protein-coupled receptor E3-like n=1 Tax=Priapulus caudatus TaxID=37621 RepID=A0ABM1E8S9_PRICU|nr:PREDICTED: adhesion G protein-coupled receptor E3-like [Priapulus caudatus]
MSANIAKFMLLANDKLIEAALPVFVNRTKKEHWIHAGSAGVRFQLVDIPIAGDADVGLRTEDGGSITVTFEGLLKLGISHGGQAQYVASMALPSPFSPLQEMKPSSLQQRTVVLDEKLREDPAVRVHTNVYSVTMAPKHEFTRDLIVKLNYPHHTVENKWTTAILCTSLVQEQHGGRDNVVFSPDGCYAHEHSDTHTVCACLHCTNFALLVQMSAVTVSKSSDLALRYLTYVGLSLSVLFATTTILVLISLKHLRSEKVFIVKNLSMTLIVTQITLMVGWERVSSHVACLLLAIMIHFFCLAVFMWMLCQAVNVVFIITIVTPPSKTQLMWLYCAIAYGIPALLDGK